MTKEVLKESVERILRTKYLKRLSEATELEILNSISDIIMEQLSDNWLRTTRAYKKVKQVHYLSIEYLIGRSFTNNLINLNMLDAVKDLPLNKPLSRCRSCRAIRCVRQPDQHDSSAHSRVLRKDDPSQGAQD